MKKHKTFYQENRLIFFAPEAPQSRSLEETPTTTQKDLQSLKKDVGAPIDDYSSAELAEFEQPKNCKLEKILTKDVPDGEFSAGSSCLLHTTRIDKPTSLTVKGGPKNNILYIKISNMESLKCTFPENFHGTEEINFTLTDGHRKEIIVDVKGDME